MEEKILAKLKEDLEKALGLAEKYDLLMESVLCTSGWYTKYVLMKVVQEAKAKYILELMEFIGSDEK